MASGRDRRVKVKASTDDDDRSIHVSQDPKDIPDPPYTIHDGKPLIKVVLCLKRKNGTTHEQFREYYENTHIKIFDHIMSRPEIVRYARRYVTPIPDSFTGVVRECGFDSLSEVWVNDIDFYKNWISGAMMEEEFSAIVAADEENVFERAETSFCVINEVVSDMTKKAGTGSDL